MVKTESIFIPEADSLVGSQSDGSSSEEDRERGEGTEPRRGVDYIKVVDIHGNVGSGKTTLSQSLIGLIESSGDHVIVCSEDLDPKEIQKMCEDRKNNTFDFQLYCQKFRKNQYIELKQRIRDEYYHEPSCRRTLWVIFDRSDLGDFVFAHYNFLSGNLTQAQFQKWQENAVVSDHHTAGERIEAHMSELRQCFEPPVRYELHISYLNKPPRDCKFHVDHVRRTAENTTPLEYYNGIHFAHELLMNFLRMWAASKDNAFAHDAKPAAFYNAHSFKYLIDMFKQTTKNKKMIPVCPKLTHSIEELDLLGATGRD